MKFRRNFAEFRRNFSFPLGTGKKYFGIFGKFRFENSKFKKIRPKFAEIHQNSVRRSPGFHRKTKWLTLVGNSQPCLWRGRHHALQRQQQGAEHLAASLQQGMTKNEGLAASSSPAATAAMASSAREPERVWHRHGATTAPCVHLCFTNST